MSQCPEACQTLFQQLPGFGHLPQAQHHFGTQPGAIGGHRVRLHRSRPQWLDGNAAASSSRPWLKWTRATKAFSAGWSASDLRMLQSGLIVLQGGGFVEPATKHQGQQLVELQGGAVAPTALTGRDARRQHGTGPFDVAHAQVHEGQGLGRQRAQQIIAGGRSQRLGAQPVLSARG